MFSDVLQGTAWQFIIFKAQFDQPLDIGKIVKGLYFAGAKFE